MFTMVEKFIDMDSMFDSIFNKLSSPEFGENLVGELPMYIQPFPPEHQGLIDEGVSRLIKRLERKSLISVSINLYTLCMEILEEEGILETILEDEKSIPRDDIMSTLDSVLDVNATIIPGIQERIEEANPDFVFITGIGSVYPFLRAHAILNNIDSLAENSKLIMFFPGEYDKRQLKLFNRISDENYYRGHNLNDITENN